MATKEQKEKILALFQGGLRSRPRIGKIVGLTTREVQQVLLDEIINKRD